MVDVIQFFKENNNKPATLEEIHKHSDVSIASIGYNLRRLARRGVIRRDVRLEIMKYGLCDKARVNIQTFCLSRYGLKNW